MSRFIPDLVNDFLKKVKKNGYAGYKVTQLIREGVWHHEYAIFQIDFNFPQFYDFDDDREYVTGPEFSEHAFWDDFCLELEREVPDCEVKWYSGTNEIEVLGTNYKKFRNENIDALEQLACNNNGHIVYKEENYVI